MEKGCINKHLAEIVSERQTREETAMFPHANNHSFPDTRKVRYSSGTGNLTRYDIHIHTYIYLFISQMYAGYVEYPTVCNTCHVSC